jgi:hypothetical protein
MVKSLQEIQQMWLGLYLIAFILNVFGLMNILCYPKNSLEKYLLVVFKYFGKLGVVFTLLITISYFVLHIIFIYGN